MNYWRRAGLPFAALLLGFLLLGLGYWQLERREWKHDLISAVDSRIHADPAAAPAPDQWGQINAEDDAYRRVRATGRFLHDKEVLVKAVTERGGGFWLITPLDLGDYKILINRGFVPPTKTDPDSRAMANQTDVVEIIGLLRLTEPKGGFLRENDPKGDRWFSRDVTMIGQSRSLDPLAPYFIDAEDQAFEGGYPVGGLTVVRFTDHHMIYALTWFVLAGLAFYFAFRVWTSPRRGDKGGE